MHMCEEMCEEGDEIYDFSLQHSFHILMRKVEENKERLEFRRHVGFWSVLMMLIN